MGLARDDPRSGWPCYNENQKEVAYGHEKVIV